MAIAVGIGATVAVGSGVEVAVSSVKGTAVGAGEPCGVQAEAINASTRKTTKPKRLLIQNSPDNQDIVSTRPNSEVIR